LCALWGKHGCAFNWGNVQSDKQNSSFGQYPLLLEVTGELNEKQKLHNKQHQTTRAASSEKGGFIKTFKEELYGPPHGGLFHLEGKPGREHWL